MQKAYWYTDTPQFMWYLHSGKSGISQILYKSELSIHMVKYICMYKTVKLKSNSTALEPGRLQHDHPAACVITQKYSSTTFISFCNHFLLGKFNVHFKNVISKEKMHVWSCINWNYVTCGESVQCEPSTDLTMNTVVCWINWDFLYINILPNKFSD